jgi:hypothetical protein
MGRPSSRFEVTNPSEITSLSICLVSERFKSLGTVLGSGETDPADSSLVTSAGKRFGEDP